MLKGLALTPPILGRISIGRVVEKNGKRLPEKDDQFTITSQVHGKDGWLAHPLNEALRREQGEKLRSIPVRLLFDDPELNFRADYCFFDRATGRPLCVGDGVRCRRSVDGEMKSLPCPSPQACPLAKNGACKPYGRLNVLIGEDDPLGTFIFRTTGFNSIRTITTRLHYLQAISGNRLSCLPLELRLRGKSTRQSMGAPIYYVDLTLRSDLTLQESLAQMQKFAESRKMVGFEQAMLENVAKAGLLAGDFEDSEDEGLEVAEEFYPDGSAAQQVPAVRAALAEKLAMQLNASGDLDVTAP